MIGIKGKEPLYISRKDHLAALEAAVKEWQDIAGKWEDSCQKLTDQIAVLETVVAVQAKVEGLITANAKQAEEIERLRRALEKISDPMTDALNFIKKTAKDALKEADDELHKTT